MSYQSACRHFPRTLLQNLTSASLLWIDCHDRPMVNGKLMVNDVVVGDYLTHTRYIISKRGGSDSGALQKLMQSTIEQIRLI